jgi:hypothetical protein
VLTRNISSARVAALISGPAHRGLFDETLIAVTTPVVDAPLVSRGRLCLPDVPPFLLAVLDARDARWSMLLDHCHPVER